MAGSTVGAVGSITLAGPPEMMIPRAPVRSRAGRSMSATTACTPSSRMRRAMRWQYWPPACRTTIWFRGRSPPLPRPPQLLRLLEDLALRLDRRRDDQLRLLQLADALRADGAHAGADGAHEVEGAVFGEGRSEQDLLVRAVHAHPDASAARQVGVRRGHAPVLAATGRLDGPGEVLAGHHGVGAGREGLAHVAARRHAAVGDDGHVSAARLVVLIARRRRVRGRRHLGDAEAQRLAAL